MNCPSLSRLQAQHVSIASKEMVNGYMGVRHGEKGGLPCIANDVCNRGTGGKELLSNESA